MLVQPLRFALLMSLIVSAAPQEDVVLRESFSVADGTLPEGWHTVRGTWRVEGGALAVDSLAGESLIVVGDVEWQNYEVEARATFFEVRDPKRWLSIVLRSSGDGAAPWSHVAVRQKSDDRSGVEFAVRTADSRWDVRMRAKGPSAAALGTERRIRVVVNGERVTGFLDGAQVVESQFCVDRPRGCVGLAVSGCRARFDDFVVRRLPDTPVPSPPKGFARRCLCVAHRGFSARAPENTLASVKAGMQAGADGCEFDVYTSRDGVAVLMHDATVNRTTNGKGKVTDLTAAQLAKLDAGSWKGKAFAGEPVPTLVGVLRAMKGSDCTAVIEVKGKGIAGPVVHAVRDAGMVESSVVISFQEEAVADVRALEPRLTGALVVGGKAKGTEAQWAAQLAERAGKCSAAILDLHYGMLSPSLIAELHRRGFKVWCWTVNDPVIMNALARWGVDGITTDRPDVMIDWRRSVDK